MANVVIAVGAVVVFASGCADSTTTAEDDAGPDVATEVAAEEVAEQPDIVPVDVALDCPGGALCPCEVADDCDEGICLEFPEGKKCAQGCVPDCPAGSACAEVPVGADLIQVCVAKWGFQCEPCTSSSQCEKAVGSHGSACVVYSAEIGAFCGAACAEDADCPAGYNCRAEKTVEGAAKKACMRVESSEKIACECDARAKKLQLSTTCEAKAEGGVCGGNRVCSAAGLSACSAAPSKEICDNKDNDCNGKTDDTLCDDGNTCTDDSCVPGVGPPAKEVCKNEANTLPCDDANACTGGDVCAATKCHGKALQCDDNNVCTDDSCDPGSAARIGLGCVYSQTKKACDDGNLCTANDLCDGKGACVGLALQASVTCNDNNLCTKDGCDANKLGADGKTGCFSKPQAGVCEDGDPCTNGDSCKAGKCAPGGNICACTEDKHCSDKEDGDLCNGTLYCNKTKAPFFCEIDPKTIVKCDTSKDSTCLKTVCGATTGKCTGKPEPKGKSCDADSSVCTLLDACLLGKCVVGKKLNCDDSNVCTDDNCDVGKGCKNVDNFKACEDGNKCTKNDTCAQGNCKPGLKLNCDDKQGCTFDYCNKKVGTCINDATPHDGDPCDADESVCTAPDKCSGGKCKAGKQKACDDGNPCTSDLCHPKQGCTAVFDNKAKCDADGKKCTPHDFCSNGLCNKGGPKNCDDGNSCTVDSCQEKTGACVHPFAALDGEKCDADGSLCTETDKCKAGKCIAGATKNCDDKNECTKDSCKPKSGCIHDKLTGSNCDDGDKCTVKDLCVVGTCGGLKLNCEDNNPCTTDLCDGGCTHATVKDGVNCGTGKHCVKAKCVVAACGDGYLAKGEQCDDGNGAVCDGCESCVLRQHLLLAAKGYGRAAGKSPTAGGVAGPYAVVNDLTIEAWIKLASIGKEQTIVARAAMKAPQLIAYRFGVTGKGELFFAHKRADVLEYVVPKNTGKAKLKVGVWAHAAVVVAGDRLRMYIDGQPAGVGKLYKSRVDSPTADVTVGRAWSDFPGGELSGSIDSVHIARAPLHGGVFTPQRHPSTSAATISLWLMDAAVGGKVADEGHAGIALNIGALKLGKDDCYGAKTDEAVCGDGKVSARLETCDDKNGALCDGCEVCQANRSYEPTSSGVIQTNSATEWAADVMCPTCSFTVEAWVRPTETKGIFEVIGTSCGMLSLALANARFGVVTHGAPLLLAATPVKKNNWYHVAGVAGFYKGAPMRIYINGKLQGEAVTPYGVGGSFAQMHKEVFFIGAGAAGTGGGCVQKGQKPLYKNQLIGQIDEVRISAGQRYGANFTAARRLLPDGATRGLWHFDGAAGQLKDDSGNQVGAAVKGGKFVADGCFGESASSAVCGDGQKATWEGCDNGGANGQPPKQCSAVCTINSKADCSALKWPLNKVATGKNVMTYAKQWTLEGWVRLPALPSKWGPIVAVQAKVLCPSMPNGQHWYVGVGPKGDDASRLGGPLQKASPAKRVWRAGVWQHFALQYNGDARGALYVDGARVRTFSGVSEGWSASCALSLGGFFDGNSHALAAELASLRLSKKARYGHAFVPPTSLGSDKNTVWAFDFDEGKGPTASDIDVTYKIDVSKASWIAKGPGCSK